MHTRTLATLVVASMLFLAGCSFGGTGSPTPTAADTSSADATPTATDTPSGQSFTYPDGYAESGVVDATAADATHRSTLTTTAGFTVTYDAVVTTPNATTYVVYDQQVETESREVLRRTNVTSGDITGIVARYYSDDTVYFKSQQPGANEPSYGNQSQQYNIDEFTGIEFVNPALTDVSFGSSEIQSRDGSQVVVYSDATLEAAEGLFGSNIDAASVTDFEATLVVDSDGVVRELRYSATIERSGGDRQVEVTVTIDEIGATTVDEPSWLSQA